MLKNTMALVGAATLCGAAFGQLSYVDQTRSVSAIGPGGGPPITQSAPDFDLWSMTAGSPGPSGGTAIAWQSSELLPLRITASGTAQRGKNLTGQIGQASSNFYAKFTSLNTSPFSYTLNSGFASGSITGPGVNIGLAGNTNNQGVFQAGGTYEISLATAGAVQSGNSLPGSYEFVLNVTGINAADQSSAFTYQGVLKSDQGPVPGAADVRYSLFPAASGAFQIGGTLEFPGTIVQNGVFTNRLDFGDVFAGKERWLEVAVRTPPGSGQYTVIGPRTRIDSTPYAAYAIKSGSVPWSGITGVPDNVANAFSPWQSATGGIAYNAGSVAIGTATPPSADNLVINDSSSARILVQSGAGTFAGIRTLTSASEYFMGSNYGSEWQVFDNKASSARLRLRANGNLSIGDIAAEQKLSVAGSIQVVTGSSTPSFLAFGGVGNTLGTAENTDLIAFQRVNLNTTTANSSELRLIIGDDNTPGASVDYFTIGTIPGGSWNPTFGFRSDGFASKPGGGTWAAISDPRTKHDVSPLKGTLDRLLTLRGYQYYYNDAEIKNGRALPGLQIGLMADEVERVFPDWVTRDRDGIRMVTERSTTALMVEALRDLRAEKDEQIERQKRQIEDLQTRMQRLEALLEEQRRRP
ncbi:MAG: tail fiber domain-containing protein [Phycisphaerales bacterium]|nr:tail fiber domain-containing protein [Phycisphaerales bacterium]